MQMMLYVIGPTGDPCRCGDKTMWHTECYVDDAIAEKTFWLRELPAPEHTYDWDEHPEDYDSPCCCEECRYYAAQDG